MHYQRKPQVDFIFAGWAPELIVQGHTVLGARAPAQLQPGCAHFSPILEEKSNFLAQPGLVSHFNVLLRTKS